MQAFVTLLWLLGSTHLQSEPSCVLDQQEILLAKALWTLIDRCLKGYIADLSLEFEQMLQNILMAASPTMQQEALQDFQPCVDVISGGLRRCATDKGVYAAEAKIPLPNGKCAATHMFIVFWMFLGESTLYKTIFAYQTYCVTPCCWASMRLASHPEMQVLT